MHRSKLRPRLLDRRQPLSENTYRMAIERRLRRTLRFSSHLP